MSGAVLESPAAKDAVKDVFGEIYQGVGGFTKDEAVAIGCSIHCALLLEAEQRGTNDLAATVKTVQDINLGIAKLSNGSVDGEVLPVITPGTVVGVEVTGLLSGIAKGGEVGVINMGDGNKVVAKIGDVEEGNVTVGLKLGEEGGLVVRVGDVEVAC